MLGADLAMDSCLYVKIGYYALPLRWLVKGLPSQRDRCRVWLGKVRSCGCTPSAVLVAEQRGMPVTTGRECRSAPFSLLLGRSSGGSPTPMKLLSHTSGQSITTGYV